MPVGSGGSGFTYWDLGACHCPSCSTTFTVTGCLGVAYPGVTVEVTVGGTVYSGVTNSSGQVTISWPGFAGTYHVQISGSSPRLTGFTGNVALTCGGAYTIALSPIAGGGYICVAGCPVPTVTTLSITDGVHTEPMIWDGVSTWTEGAYFFCDMNTSLELYGATGGCIYNSGNPVVGTLVSCPPALQIDFNVTACPLNPYTVTE